MLVNTENKSHPTRLPLQKQLSLENDAGDGVMFRMAKSDQGRSYALRGSKCFGRSRKNQKRFATLFFLNVDVAPAHRFADSGTERLCHRLFSGETRSQMTRREFHRHRIFDFTIGENSMEETISKPVNGALNARAFHK